MESSPQFTVAPPCRPAAPYIGGKRNLAKRLVGLIEATPHRTYAEPFVGMGGVFLRRRLRPQSEIINDWSKEVATFYRVLQRHHLAFLDELRWRMTSRVEFDRLMAVDPETLTDLERAARFLYLQRLAFGGRVHKQHFGMDTHRPARFDPTRLVGDLQDLHDRLAGVKIERLPFDAFIGRYDSAETLFLIDPPYWDSEDDYGREMFAKADFDRLRDLLERLQGRFILTINDVPETRTLFGGFEVQPVDVSYGVTGKGATPARELIIRGGRA